MRVLQKVSGDIAIIGGTVMLVTGVERMVVQYRMGDEVR